MSEDLQGLIERLKSSKPFVAETSHERFVVQHEKIKLSDGKELFVKEFIGDPHTSISLDDSLLKDIIVNITSQIQSETTSLKEINNLINRTFPINFDVTDGIRSLRREKTGRLLGEYFQPQGGLPYTAVCIHKALLEQAVASVYGIKTELVEFGFLGQIRENNANDGISGMHAALRYIDENNISYISDPHKGLYLLESEYWEIFDNVAITNQREVFTPEMETIYN